MVSKIRLKGFGASMRVGAVLALLSAGTLQGAFIWQNNNLAGSSGIQNDSNTSGGQWTVFDNFTTPTTSSANWVVTTLDFTDYIVNGKPADIKNTTWSIWSGDPLSNNGTLVASGLVTPGGSLAVSRSPIDPNNPNNANLYQFTISGLYVTLAPGTKYYLGATNSVMQDSGFVQATSTFRAKGLDPGLPGSTPFWEQSNGSINSAAKVFDSGGASNTTITNSFTIFDVQGAVTPEPGTWALMGIAMPGFFLLRRRRIA